MRRSPCCIPGRALLASVLVALACGAVLRAEEADAKRGLQPKARPGPSGGAGTHSARGKTERRSLQVNGMERTYRLYVPLRDERSAPLPLIISLHGAGASGAIHQALCGFDALADEHGFAVAYPDGVARLWRFWEAPHTREDRPQPRAVPDDVAFIAGLIDSLVGEGLVDRRRVYVNGMSNGAYMTHRLACELGDRLAAVAAVAGTLPRVVAEEWRPPRPIPCMYFHGTADAIVRIEGVDAVSRGRLSLSAADLVAWWARHNRCSQPAIVEELPDTEMDGTRVRRHTYQPDADGAPVVYYEIIDGGHTWPGGGFQPRFLLGTTCRDVNASKLMWEFFSQYQLPEQEAQGAIAP